MASQEYRKSRSRLSKSPKEILELSRIILHFIRFNSNVLLEFEELKRIFPRLRLKIVDDIDMPNEEARAYPKKWIIKIRRSIYEGLLCGLTRGRWTLLHELGHVLLQHPGHSVSRSDTKKYSAAARIF